MRFPVGVIQDKWEREQEQISVFWDEARVVNSHIMFAGKSGAGKSSQLRRAIRHASASAEGRVRFHVFDRHNDLDTPGESVVKFSESTPYGCINPLAINPHPHFGGVRKQIAKFITGITRRHALGARQQAALRRLLQDLYKSRGFSAKDPRTWCPLDPAEVAARMKGRENRVYLDVPFAQKDLAKAAGAAFDVDMKAWWVPRERYEGELLLWAPKSLAKANPTLDDAVVFARRRLEAAYLGTNTAAVHHLQDVNKYAARYHKLCLAHQKNEALGEELERLLKSRNDAQDKAIEAFQAYLQQVQTGRELDEVLELKSAEVMHSVYDRLTNLNDVGIFRPEPPPFDPNAAVWRYDISALQPAEAEMFVHFVLAERFDRAVERGQQQQVQEIVCLDESDIFFSDDEDNMPNKIAKEARKFGLCLWAVSQSPSNFSEAFLVNIGAKFIFRLDDSYWEKAARSLKISRNELERLRPKYNGLVQIENSSDERSQYQRVIFTKS